MPDSDPILAAIQRMADAAAVDSTPDRYYVAVFPDGGNARLLGFSTLSRLGKWMKKSDGLDGFVVPFVGRPLGFTEGPRRRLMLGDGQELDIHTGVVSETDMDDAEEPQVQTDWYFGPAVLRPVREEPV